MTCLFAAIIKEILSQDTTYNLPMKIHVHSDKSQQWGANIAEWETQNLILLIAELLGYNI